MMKELWKIIKGYQNYKISNFGRVYSQAREINYIRNGQVITSSLQGRILNPKINKTCGYAQIGLIDQQGTRKTFYVHRLVADHFCEKSSKLRCIVMHLDDDRTNNHANNLKYATQEENVGDMLRKSRGAIGSATNRNILTEDDIPKIVALLRKGKPTSLIAKDFSVAFTTIHAIKRGHTWRHVSGIKSGEFEESKQVPRTDSKGGTSKLTEENVLKIVALHAKGVTQSELSRQFHVGTTTISYIVHGLTWSQVTGIKRHRL